MGTQAQLLHWVSRVLSQLFRDATPSFIHQQVIKAALTAVRKKVRESERDG